MSHVITAARLIDRVGHLGAKHNMVSLEDSDADTRVAVMSNLCFPSASCLWYGPQGKEWVMGFDIAHDEIA